MFPLSSRLQPGRGRYAPSPTGWLHVGNARTALAAWLSARAQGATFVMRVEDLDGPRLVPGMTEALLDDLRWLGLDWDEGPGLEGPDAPYYQSQRSEIYESALQHLYQRGRLFPCSLSRKDLLSLASAPHEADTNGLPPYPATLRPETLPDDWFDTHRQGQLDASIRFQVVEEPVTFHDRVYGTCTESVQETVGDFVLKRRDGLYAYQLAVVVDDLLMGMGEVVRGADLLTSTARQIQLIEALGGTPPVYAHVPLVVNAAGEKLSKRDDGLTIHSLRALGLPPEALVGYLGFSLGLMPNLQACEAATLVSGFRWDRIPRQAWRLPEDLADLLCQL